MQVQRQGAIAQSADPHSSYIEAVYARNLSRDTCSCGGHLSLGICFSDVNCSQSGQDGQGHEHIVQVGKHFHLIYLAVNLLT